MLHRLSKAQASVLISIFTILIIYSGFFLLKGKHNMHTVYNLKQNEEVVIDGTSLKVVSINDLKIVDSGTFCCREAEVVGFPVSNPDAPSSEVLLNDHSFRVGDNIFYVKDITSDELDLEYVKLPINPTDSSVLKVGDESFEYKITVNQGQYPMYNLSATDKKTKKILWQREFSASYLSMSLVGDGLLLKNPSGISILDKQTGIVKKYYFAPSDIKSSGSNYVYGNWQAQYRSIVNRGEELTLDERDKIRSNFVSNFIGSSLSDEQVNDYGTEYKYSNQSGGFSVIISNDGSLYMKSDDTPFDVI